MRELISIAKTGTAIFYKLFQHYSNDFMYKYGLIYVHRYAKLRRAQLEMNVYPFQCHLSQTTDSVDLCVAEVRASSTILQQKFKSTLLFYTYMRSSTVGSELPISSVSDCAQVREASRNTHYELTDTYMIYVSAPSALLMVPRFASRHIDDLAFFLIVTPTSFPAIPYDCFL